MLRCDEILHEILRCACAATTAAAAMLEFKQKHLLLIVIISHTHTHTCILNYSTTKGPFSPSVHSSLFTYIHTFFVCMLLCYSFLFAFLRHIISDATTQCPTPSHPTCVYSSHCPYYDLHCTHTHTCAFFLFMLCCDCRYIVFFLISGRFFLYFVAFCIQEVVVLVLAPIGSSNVNVHCSFLFCNRVHLNVRTHIHSKRMHGFA
jgi:hypothetical protein